MSPEDGAEKAIEYLKPLMIKKPLTTACWLAAKKTMCYINGAI
jgi:hypothetical protein